MNLVSAKLTFFKIWRDCNDCPVRVQSHLMCLKTSAKQSTFSAWTVLGETSVYEDFTGFIAIDWYISINCALRHHSKQQLPCLLASVLHWRWLKRDIIHSRAKWASAIRENTHMVTRMCTMNAIPHKSVGTLAKKTTEAAQLKHNTDCCLFEVFFLLYWDQFSQNVSRRAIWFCECSMEVMSFKWKTDVCSTSDFVSYDSSLLYKSAFSCMKL